MNRFIVLIIVLISLNHCSVSENLGVWKSKEKNLEADKNMKKIFSEEKRIVAEFNQELKLDLNKIKINEKFINNSNDNNYGSQNYDGILNKIGNYKFSKLEDINQLNFKPIFLKDGGIIFFDKKGSIIRYNETQKVLWKNNYYSKAEKKLKPKINFIIDNQNLIVADSIAKYYSIDLNTGELNWSKNNTYPFNSEVKKKKTKFLL